MVRGHGGSGHSGTVVTVAVVKESASAVAQPGGGKLSIIHISTEPVCWSMCTSITKVSLQVLPHFADNFNLNTGYSHFGRCLFLASAGKVGRGWMFKCIAR